MEIIVACLHIAAYLLLGLGLSLPALRRAAVVGLLVAAIASLLAGRWLEPRPLTTVHTYAGYDGAALEVSMVSFPTGTVETPWLWWPLPFTAFAAGWIAILLLLGQRPLRQALLLPLLFAWTGIAAWLGMQIGAAPALLVQPVGLDRFLWPAGLALALVVARTAKSFVGLFLSISVGTMLGRLPAALFSKYASDQGLGTCLDISKVRDIVNPMTQATFDPPLVLGSGAQQFWLIWLQHTIFFPAVYLLSLLGIAFGAWMFHRHGAPRALRARPAETPGSR